MRWMPKGFTLIEVLVSALIVAFMGVVLLSLYIYGYNAYRTGAAEIQTQEGARIVLMQIGRILDQACSPSPFQNAVNTPGFSGGEGVHATGATLYIPAGALANPPSPFNPISPSYEEMAINEVNDQIRLYDPSTYNPADTSTYQVVAGGISSIDFYREGNNALKISVQQKEVIKNASGESKTILSTGSQTFYFPQQ